MQIIEKKSVPNIGIFIAAIVLSLAMIVFFVIPKYSQWQQSKQAALQSKEQLNILQDEYNKVGDSLQKIQDNQSSLTLANQAIPNSADIPNLYAHIEQLAKGSNLILTSIQAQDENTKDKSGQIDASGFSSQLPSAAPADSKIEAAPSPSLGIVDVNMEVKGPVSSFNNLLGSLEKSLRFIDVQSVEISASNSQQSTSISNPNLMSFRLVLKTYYQKK